MVRNDTAQKRNLVYFLLDSLDPKHLSLETDLIQKRVYDRLRQFDGNFLRNEVFMSKDDMRDPDTRNKLFHSLAAQTAGSFVAMGACLARFIRIAQIDKYGMETYVDKCLPDNSRYRTVHLAFAISECDHVDERVEPEEKDDVTRIREGNCVKEMLIQILSQSISKDDEYDESEFDLTEEEFLYVSGQNGFDSLAKSVRSKLDKLSARTLRPLAIYILGGEKDERERRKVERTTIEWTYVDESGVAYSIAVGGVEKIHDIVKPESNSYPTIDGQERV